MDIEPKAAHASVWLKMQAVIDNDRLPHALLLIGPRHAGLLQFANRLMAILVCHQVENAPCSNCKPCRLLLQASHPDIYYLNQDSPTSAIKIDQIRVLQQDVYKTPQMGARRFIVIEPADRLNTAAANALLKILEEPPSHTMFILIAEQVSTIPATVMSRCQQYVFLPPEGLESIERVNYLSMANYYPENSARGELFKQTQSILTALCEGIEGNASICSIAASWAKFALDDLLWFLYLLTAQIIYYKLSKSQPLGPLSSSFSDASRRIDTVTLFKQLDKITELLTIVQKNITLNQTLVVEALLSGYVTGITHES